MRINTIISTLNNTLYLISVELSVAKLKSAGEQRPAKNKRFRDVLAEAKRTAIDEYLGRLLGSQKITNERSQRRDGLNNLREDFELLMYARKLETLFRKYV